MPVAVFVCRNGVPLTHRRTFYAWPVAPDYAQETSTGPAFIGLQSRDDWSDSSTDRCLDGYVIDRSSCVFLWRHRTFPPSDVTSLLERERRLMTDGNWTCTSCEIYLRRRRRTHNRQTVVEAAPAARAHLRHSISGVQQLLQQQQQRRTTSTSAEFTHRVGDVWYSDRKKRKRKRETSVRRMSHHYG